MSKGKLGKPWRMRWEPAEWLKVATMAVGMIEQGCGTADAIQGAQRAVLPRHRWHEAAYIAKLATPSNITWQKYLTSVSAMSAAERDSILLAEVRSPKPSKEQLSQPAKPEPSPEPAPAVTQSRKPGENAGHVTRWTGREWALVARAARWEAERFPDEPLHVHVNRAQQWALPPDRQRPVTAITQAFYKRSDSGRSLLAVQVQEGINRGWTINNIPFTPPGSEPDTPDTPPPAPAEPVEAAPSIGGALPIAPQFATLTEAAKAFGETMMHALDSLLHTHTQLMLAEVNQRITATAADTGTQVAAMIEAAMRRTVHSMVEQELGGPVSPPAGPADEPAASESIKPAPIPQVEPRRARVKVDVIGTLNSPVRVQVRDSFADASDVDLRFFDGSHHERYKPDPNRHCIFLSKRASHGLFDKLKKYKIQPIYVEPSAAYITHAIEELQRAAMQ